MKSVLLFTVLLLVLDGTFSSIEKSFEFEKRSNNRVRRDIVNFQTQMDDATAIDLNNMTTCPTFPCLSGLSSDYCGAFCQLNATAYGLLSNSIIDCYKSGLCGKDFVNIQLNNVNISIAPGSYDGKCYLYGNQVKMTLKTLTNTLRTYSPDAAYRLSLNLQYVWEGLTLSCQPCTTTTIINGGSQIVCCGNSLLNQLICAVQQLVGSLGLTLNLLSCNCNCGGASIWGKRQPNVNTAFQSPVNVTQEEYFDIFFLAQPHSATDVLGNYYIYTYVNLGSTIPSQYANDINVAIEMVFTDYYTFKTIQYNFYNAYTSVLGAFFSTCGGYCN